MERARILAGVATFAVACALSSPASAQIGACPVLQPPPCIINDPTKIASTAAEIKNKVAELQSLTQQVQQLTDLNSILGSVGGAKAKTLFAIVPPLTTGPAITFSEAANQLNGALRSYPATQEGQASARAEDRLRLRAAAGEGYATATALKARLADFKVSYDDLFRRLLSRAEATTAQNTQPRLSEIDAMRIKDSIGAKQFDEWYARHFPGQPKPGSEKPQSLEEDWEMNGAARIMLFNLMLLKREADAARLQLTAMRSVQSQAGQAGGSQPLRREPAPAQPTAAPQHNIDLGQLIGVVNQAVQLKAALDIVQSMAGAIAGNKQTQAEYQAMVAAKATAQGQVEQLAIADARRKGMNPQSLLSAANSIMQQLDRTTWDDPSKRTITTAAAKRAETYLDKLVRGQVSDSWSGLLAQRAEAFKQEAFFREINADAIASEQAVKQSMSQLSGALGVDVSNQEALAQAAAAANAKVQEIAGRLNGAPADVVSIRDRLLANSGFYAPPAGAAPARTPQTAPSYGSVGFGPLMGGSQQAAQTGRPN